MRLIVTGMFRGLCEFVCLLELNTTISCAKTAEPIEMPFVMWTRRGGAMNHVSGDTNRPRGMGNFEGSACDVAFR